MTTEDHTGPVKNWGEHDCDGRCHLDCDGRGSVPGGGPDRLQADLTTSLYKIDLMHRRSAKNAYHRAVAEITAAARVLRDYDLDLEDREAMRAALRRARVIR